LFCFIYEHALTLPNCGPFATLLLLSKSPWWNNVHIFHFAIFGTTKQRLLNLKWFFPSELQLGVLGSHVHREASRNICFKMSFMLYFFIDVFTIGSLEWPYPSKPQGNVLESCPKVVSFKALKIIKLGHNTRAH